MSKVDITISNDDKKKINDTVVWLQDHFSSYGIAGEVSLSISNGYTISSRQKKIEYFILLGKINL